MLKKLAPALLLLSVLLASCSAFAPQPTATPTSTPTASPTETPTATPNPYASVDIFTPTTYQAIETGFVNRTPADPGSALEQQYDQENLAFHQIVFQEMANYLGRSWTEANSADYDQCAQLYVDFRNKVNGDTSIVDKSSPIDPWRIAQTLSAPPIKAYTTNDGEVVGGVNYGLGFATEKAMIDKYGSVNNFMNAYRQDTAKRAFSITAFGQNIRINRAPASGPVYLEKILDVSAVPNMPGSYIVTGVLDGNALYSFTVHFDNSSLGLVDIGRQIFSDLKDFIAVYLGKSAIIDPANSSRHPPSPLEIFDVIRSGQ